MEKKSIEIAVGIFVLIGLVWIYALYYIVNPNDVVPLSAVDDIGITLASTLGTIWINKNIK